MYACVKTHVEKNCRLCHVLSCPPSSWTYMSPPVLIDRFHPSDSLPSCGSLIYLSPHYEMTRCSLTPRFDTICPAPSLVCHPSPLSSPQVTPHWLSIEKDIRREGTYRDHTDTLHYLTWSICHDSDITWSSKLHLPPPYASPSTFHL